jgi:hypothetical protein
MLAGPGQALAPASVRRNHLDAGLHRLLMEKLLTLDCTGYKADKETGRAELTG